MKMYLPLSLLMCLSVIQLTKGDLPVEEVIVPKKVYLLGGWSPISPESTDVQKAAQHAVTLFNTNSNSRKMFKLVSITAAESQVTNVINFKMKAVLGRTNCIKSENHALDSCTLEKRLLKCLFKVSFDPRDNRYEMLSDSCTRLVEMNTP